MNTAWGRRVHRSTRSGFTLVELLIVIILIGILAGAMLLVRQRGQDSADATVIVNDLRTMKAAALMFDADNPKRDLTPLIGGNAIKHLEKFMDRSVDETRDYLFIYPEMPSVGGIPMMATEGCKKKLADMAESTALLGGSDPSSFFTGGTDRPFVVTDMIVGMRAK